MKNLAIICFLVFGLRSLGQINLVPNSSFENLCKSCNYAMWINNSCNWYKTGSSPDYYNVCANWFAYPEFSTIPHNCVGYQNPHNGNAYCGIWAMLGFDGANFDTINYDSEYISVNLKDTLIKDHYYYGEFYISLSNRSNIGINQIGMYLSSTTFTATQYTFTNTIQPQIAFDTTQCFIDTLNWVKVSGCFQAKGGERQLTIGNFKDGNHIKKQQIQGVATACSYLVVIGQASYIYIDDVSLYELPLAKAINDSILCRHDTLIIGANPIDTATYSWAPATGLSCTSCPNPVADVSSSISYTVTKTMCNFQSTDVVTLGFQNPCTQTTTPTTPTTTIILPEETALFPNTFTPNEDGINDAWRFKLGTGNTLTSLSVYNRWGNLVHTIDPATLGKAHGGFWDGRTTAGEACTEGVYFYTIEYTDREQHIQKIKGYISLFR